MKRRLAGFFLMVFLVVLACAGSSWADFVTVNGSTMYKTASGKYLTGFQKIDGEIYYFNSSGVLKKKGWIKTSDGNEYYASKTGALLRNQWFKNRRKYYLTDSGAKAKGLTKIENKLYYFSTTNGKLQKGKKLKDKDGSLYITNKKGIVYQNILFKFKTATYYAGADGKLAKGLTKIGNHLYFFKKKGKMAAKSLKTVNGATYYFKKRGRAARSQWVKIKGNYYYFQEDCTMAKSQFVGNWYVDENGVRKTASEAPSSGLNKIDGKYYIYDSNGKLVKNKWVKVGEDTYYASSDGSVLTGVQTLNSKKYYFDEDGVLQTDSVVEIDGKYYTTNEKGVITGTTEKSGAAIVAYAKKFLGMVYAWGGTSLKDGYSVVYDSKTGKLKYAWVGNTVKKGADCSGFCQAVFLKFGIQLLRTADDQMKGPTKAYQKLGYKKGVRVKDKDLQPGDLVFYDKSKDGVMDHVAMYIGKNKVIHEAGSKYGCVITAIDWASGRVKNKGMRYWA